MKIFRNAGLLLAAIVGACAPAAAQRANTLPIASTLNGSERIFASQGSGCATNVAPCASVSVQPPQIATFLTGTFQPKDADLDAIAALATQPFGRSILTQADAASVRAALGLGTLATQSGTFSGTSSGTNTGDQTSITGNAGTATKLATGRTIALTGDVACTTAAFDGTANVSAACAFASTAWTSFTLNFAAGTTAPTSAVAGGRYKAFGKTAFVQIYVTITTNGPASTFLSLTGFPFAPTGTGSSTYQNLSGRRVGSPYEVVSLNIQGGTAYLQRYDGAYAGGDNQTFIFSGVIEIS